MTDPETAPETKRATSRRLLGDDRPLAPTSDRGWLLVEEGFTSVREHEIESIFAIANGYVGARASLEEGSRVSQPATFVAGIYVDNPASRSGRHSPSSPIGHTSRSPRTATACRWSQGGCSSIGECSTSVRARCGASGGNKT
jgi:hypothetical protein